MQNVQSTALNTIECPYPEPYLLLPNGLYVHDSSHKEEEAQFISNFLPIIDTKLCTGLYHRQIRGLRYFYVNSETVICQVRFL